MGGQGSGDYYRVAKRTYIEEVQRLELLALKRAGYLDSGYRSGSWCWTRNGERSGEIRLISFGNVLELSYRFRTSGSDQQAMRQRIQLTSTPCHLGGVRKWFLCPHCRRRVGVLAFGQAGFSCRHCYQLPYSSQAECRLDRIRRAREKIGKRIFEDYQYGEYGRKRKGMHRKTFDREFARWLCLDEQWYAGMLAFCWRHGLTSEATMFEDYFLAAEIEN